MQDTPIGLEAQPTNTDGRHNPIIPITHSFFAGKNSSMILENLSSLAPP